MSTSTTDPTTDQTIDALTLEQVKTRLRVLDTLLITIAAAAPDEPVKHVQREAAAYAKAIGAA